MFSKVTVCRVKYRQTDTFVHPVSFGYPDYEEWGQFFVRAAVLAGWYGPTVPSS